MFFTPSNTLTKAQSRPGLRAKCLRICDKHINSFEDAIATNRSSKSINQLLIEWKETKKKIEAMEDES